MVRFLTCVRRFREDENGAAMVEYTILLGMITIAVIASVVLVSAWVTGQWSNLAAALP